MVAYNAAMHQPSPGIPDMKPQVGHHFDHIGRTFSDLTNRHEKNTC